MSAGDRAAVNLLDDLCDEATDHSWLWLLASHGGPRASNVEVTVAVRLRIGADVAAVDQECACCGSTLDRTCLHASRCAPGESNRGHYTVSSVVHGLASLADASSSLEPAGLVPSRPALRPADVLTSAAFCLPAALDICVASPDSAGAGINVCISAAARKSARYQKVIEELRAEGYDYKPLIWTCWGRPSLDAQAAIRTLAAVAARRRGLSSPLPLEMRARALIGAHIWRRAALMALSCLQRPAATDAADLLPAGDWCNDVGSDSVGAAEEACLPAGGAAA